MTPVDWGITGALYLAVAVVQPAVRWAAAWARARRHATQLTAGRPDDLMALADATTDPPGLTCGEREAADGYAAWITAHPHGDAVQANGHAIADYLRLAVPDLGDLALGRVTLALAIAAQHLHQAAPGRDDARQYVILTDAIAAAAVHLVSLERELQP